MIRVCCPTAFRVTLVAGFTMLLTSAYYRVPAANVMAESANAFLNSLTAEQKAKATFDMKDAEREFFHFVPDNNIQQTLKRGRKGLTLREMTPAQKHLAQAMLSAGLSQRGYIKATSIMSLEDILRILEKDDGERRNPEKYYFSVFGKPADQGAWGYRVEGHHLSLSFTVIDGKVIGAPMFYGTNPAMVKEGPRAGLRVLAREEDLGRELFTMLSDDQKKTALVQAEAYKDILTGADRRAALKGQPNGLPVSKLNAKQKAALQALLEEYCHNLPEQVAQYRLDQIKKSAGQTYFAWAGSAAKGEGHYYRVSSPAFLVEYDNTQNGNNHVHSIWRDMEGNDFGEDLLKAHLRASHGTDKLEVAP
ncbi:MAG: DUF3500 domain-containing protein [Bryobacterales bacterium]|nr:DUF3500 domain-containing protein [Bryobacterales bacterium]